MKIKQLIKKLQLADENDIVVLSSDAEGNNYRELYDVMTCAVFDESNNEIDDANNTTLVGAKHCVVLYPED